MIISDLNYLEDVSQETKIVGGFSSDYANVYFRESVDIDKNVNQDVDISGQFASSESNASAYGQNTLSETFQNAYVYPYGTASNGTAIAASAPSYR
ncbi:MAG: hypothetical protein JOZ78_13250 [Chroococcidiopsidaceae cyanobacterium CP_BM_ER_R8_30]|nr:hypothetical protein [Chroococcidiopsidaceae cyanobacterium CP_BM_ER_R8_30]